MNQVTEKRASSKAVSETASTQDKPWRKVADWLKMHEEHLEQRKRLPAAELVFLGDSITYQWQFVGIESWNRYFASRSLNMGIGGDETQHVLWRIEHGCLDDIDPKALVLLIGTNNVGNSGHNGTDSAAGVKKVVEAIRQKLPSTKILLLAVFPRDERPGTPFRQEVATLNAIISALHDGKMIHYVDFGPRFLQPDGVLPKALFRDFLHLSAEAYAILAEAIVQELKRILS